MGDRTKKIAVILGIVASVVTIILFVEQSKTLPWVTDMLSEVISPPLLKLVLAALILLLLAICFWRQNLLKKQIEEHISTTSPPVPSLFGLFRIKPYYIKLHWSKQGKNELHSFGPDIVAPDNATLTQEVQARIETLPFRRMKNIELEIPGYSPLSSFLESGKKWPQPINSEAIILYFTIPSFVKNGKYSVTLIATMKEEESEVQKRSTPFDIILTRSYDDLPK